MRGPRRFRLRNPSGLAAGRARIPRAGPAGDAGTAPARSRKEARGRRPPGRSVLVRCDRPVGIERDAPFQAIAALTGGSQRALTRMQSGGARPSPETVQSPLRSCRSDARWRCSSLRAWATSRPYASCSVSGEAHRQCPGSLSARPGRGAGPGPSGPESFAMATARRRSPQDCLALRRRAGERMLCPDGRRSRGARQSGRSRLLAAGRARRDRSRRRA
jgi:hypothetical protein